jgi:hypothetical protein
MRRTALALMPAAFAIMSAVQCVVSPGGSAISGDILEKVWQRLNQPRSKRD